MSPSKCQQNVGMQHRMSVLTVCLLGIGRIVGARCKYWNEGLKVGQDYFFVFAAVECVGIILMGSCLAEMAGALPFTGGTYGYARGIFGPYMGFLVGVFEIVTNVSGLSTLVVAFAQACVNGLDVSIGLFPVFFVLLFILTALLQLLTTKQYTNAMIVLTIVSILLTILYTVGSIFHFDYSKYAYNSDIPRTSVLDILSYAPIPTYFFTGLEMLPILAHFAKEPRRAITYGIGSTVCFGVLAMCSTLVLAVGQAPGIIELQTTSLPLNFGFANIFNISTQIAVWFNIPLLMTSFMIGEYFLCINLRSLYESRLLFIQWKPSVKMHSFSRPFPVKAMVLSYVMMILFSMLIFSVLYFSFQYIMNLSYFVSLCFYGLYICLFLTYISFARRFPLIPRYFVSPFGVWGAYLGIIIYACMAVMTFLYPHGGIVLSLWLILMAALTYYYLTRIRRFEKFSGEEERIFFIAYVIKANYNSKQRIARHASFKKHSYSWLDRILRRILSTFGIVDPFEPLAQQQLTLSQSGDVSPASVNSSIHLETSDSRSICNSYSGHRTLAHSRQIRGDMENPASFFVPSNSADTNLNHASDNTVHYISDDAKLNENEKEDDDEMEARDAVFNVVGDSSRVHPWELTDVPVDEENQSLHSLQSEDSNNRGVLFSSSHVAVHRPIHGRHARRAPRLSFDAALASKENATQWKYLQQYQHPSSESLLAISTESSLNVSTNTVATAATTVTTTAMDDRDSTATSLSSTVPMPSRPKQVTPSSSPLFAISYPSVLGRRQHSLLSHSRKKPISTKVVPVTVSTALIASANETADAIVEALPLMADANTVEA